VRKKKETTAATYNGLPYWAAIKTVFFLEPPIMAGKTYYWQWQVYKI